MSCLLHYCLAFCCALLLFQASEAVGQGKRVIVLLDDTALKSTHSLFFSSLTARGYQLTYSAANAPDLSIKDWDNYLYDKVIVFASSTSGTWHIFRPSCSCFGTCREWSQAESRMPAVIAHDVLQSLGVHLMQLDSLTLLMLGMTCFWQ